MLTARTARLSFSRYHALSGKAFGLLFALAAAAVLSISVASPANAATAKPDAGVESICGSYLEVWKTSSNSDFLIGPGTRIGTDSYNGTTLTINRFSFYNHLAHVGAHLQPYSQVPFIYTNTTNGDVRVLWFVASSSGVIRPGNHDYPNSNPINVNNLLYPGRWQVEVLWVADCGEQENYSLMGFVQVT